MRRWILLLLIGSLGGAFSTARAITTTISDTYWGGIPSHSWSDRDIVGTDNLFDISHMNVTHEEGRLQYIDIYSRYFDNIGQYSTGLGDFFLSVDGWNPHGDAPYVDDYYLTGEDWEYALVLDNHSTSGGGQFGLYQISDDDIILSSAPNGYAYRQGQEVQVNTNGLSSLATGGWSIHNLGGNDFDDFLRLDLTSFDYDFGSVNFGFHYTMTCGNDVIEGGAVLPVPEPGTLFLFGTSLIGFGIMKKRKKFNLWNRGSR